MSLTDDLDQTIAGIRLALQSVNGPRNAAPVSGTIKEQKGVATVNVPPCVWADKKSISPALTPSSSELTPANGFREGQDELSLEIERLQQERRQLEREIEKTDRRFINKNSESQENTAQNVDRSLLPDVMQSMPKLEGWEENLSKFSKEYEEHFTKSENESPPKVSSNKLQIQRSAGPTVVRAATAAPSQPAVPAVRAAAPVQAGSTHANQHLGIVRTEYTDEVVVTEFVYISSSIFHCELKCAFINAFDLLKSLCLYVVRDVRSNCTSACLLGFSWRR
jgi:hypothetical protein